MRSQCGRKSSMVITNAFIDCSLEVSVLDEPAFFLIDK
jgi:hypothetical protein